MSSEYLEMIFIFILMLVIETLDTDVALFLLCRLHLSGMRAVLLELKGDEIPVTKRLHCVHFKILYLIWII